jgi:beta-glucanase (GH16 family)
MIPISARYLILTALLFAITFSSCSKDEDDTSTDDPSGLKVEILSIDHETGYVEIQASAQNTNLYQLYIEPSDVPEDVNNTGYFEYTFESQGMHEFSVRAYGASGRYVKVTTEVTIAVEEEAIPLSRGYYSATEYAGFNLVWQDEFNGFSLNTNDWGYDIGNGQWGWGNNELEYYRTDNAWVSDSVLTIEARNDGYGGFDYTSAKIKTAGKKSFQYGRIDIRALLPAGKGIWPAIWMLGDNFNSVGWPDCGEIDIMEMIGGNGGESTIYGTLHWEYNGENASAGGSKTLSSGVYNYNEAYHVFSILWNENFIKFYVDDQQFHVIDITAGDMTEFHQPHWFILNVAVGGNWPGSPDATTIFPQQMKVDYIRVFQEN